MKYTCDLHEMIHIGEKPYKCQCEKTFPKKVTCIEHERIQMHEIPSTGGQISGGNGGDLYKP